MNSKKSIFFFLILVFISLLFIFSNKNNDISKKYRTDSIRYVKIAGQTVKVELAETSEAQSKGLSGRNRLSEDEGMLFVFDRPSKYPFWMKDMNFPIDIIWIGQDLQVVFIKKNVTPQTYPESFQPTKNALYVLEVVSGFSDKNNLVEGNSAVFLP